MVAPSPDLHGNVVIPQFLREDNSIELNCFLLVLCFLWQDLFWYNPESPLCNSLENEFVGKKARVPSLIAENEMYGCHDYRARRGCRA